MHMADALISPTVGISFWAGSIGIIAYCANKLKNEFNEKIIPLMGVMGAFIFAGQMINFTIPATGSSGHIGGGLLLTIVLGPWAAFITIASVLFIQALFFADGGLLALGCNIWNMGVYPCFIAYPIYTLFVDKNPIKTKIMIGTIAATIIGLELGAFSVALQTVFSGITELPFSVFVPTMLSIHLPIAIVEGVLTSAIIIYVQNIQPNIIYSYYNNDTKNHSNLKRVLISMGIFALITGGILSWFASTHPDGLEWSMSRITGKEEVSEGNSQLHKAFSNIQEKVSILPDYDFKKTDSQEESSDEMKQGQIISPGTSVSGIIGGTLTLTMIVIIGLAIKLLSRKKSATG